MVTCQCICNNTVIPWQLQHKLKKFFRNAKTFQILVLFKKRILFFSILFYFIGQATFEESLMKHSGLYLIFQNETFKFN
jgi:hypothetical protein